MPPAIIHRRIPCTNHAHQIIAAFKWLRWAYPDDTIPQGLKKFERHLTRRGHIIPCGDARLETQPSPPQHVDKMLNNTHFMLKHPPMLVDVNKCCQQGGNTRCAFFLFIRNYELLPVAQQRAFHLTPLLGERGPTALSPLACGC